MAIPVEELLKKLQRQPEGKQQKLSRMTRELQVDTESIDADKYYAEFSVSSEYPVQRWFGYEILDHQKSSIRTQRLELGAAHRDGHWGDQIGIIEKWWIDDQERKLRVGVKFSKNTARAVEIFKDIVDGIRKNVSIDYDIHGAILEKEEEGVATYRITDWEFIHSCSCPDGADPTSGIGRTADPVPAEPNNDNSNRTHDDKTKIFINTNRSEKGMTEEEKKELERQQREAAAKAAKDAGELETLRIRGIRMMAHDMKRNLPGINVEDEAEKFVADGKSEVEFYRHLSAKLKDPNATRTPEAHVPDEELKDYNFSRAILYAADNKIADLGVEREVSDHLKKTLNRSTKGLLVPTNVFNKKLRAQVRESRTANQNVSTPAAGGNTVNEQVIAQSFIEFLTNSLIAVNAGVTFLPGMSGDVPFIRELDELGYNWTGESGTNTGSGITYSRVNATPKHIVAKTSISRQMLLQSPYVSEAYSKRKLFGALRRGIDRGIFYGTGANNQPRGVKNLTGTHGFVGTGFNRSKAISMRAALKADNAELGGVSFLANPVTAGELMDIPIAANYPAFLLNEDSMKMVGRLLWESNQIDEGDLFLGVWNSVYLLEWGYLDVSANPYGTGWDVGDIEVRALHAVDVVAEYPQAIGIAEGVAKAV